MGAEVQSNMYFPGYYTLRNVKDNVGTGGTNHGNHFERFLARSSVFGDNSWYAKEQMKQTILKHEYTFKHQLQELHRIYRRQRDLMNDIKCQSYELRISEKTSQSSLFSSRIAYEDNEVEWYGPNFCCLDPSSSRPSTSTVGIIKSPFILMEKKETLPAGSLSTYSGMRSGNRDSHDLTCKKLQRRLFDLELPADKYNSDEEKTWKSYELDINNEPNLVEESNFGTRKHRLVDLNESVQVEEVLVAASINALGNNGYSRGWLSSTNLTSSFHPLTTDSSDDTKRKDGAASLDSLHLQTGSSTKDSCGSFSGVEHTTSGKYLGRSSDQMKFNLEKVGDPLRASQVDFCQSKAKTKKTIFGVELTRGHDLPFIGSDICCLDLDRTASSKLQSSSPDGINHSERLQNEVLSSNNLMSIMELKVSTRKQGNLHWNAGDTNICKRMESSSLQSSPQLHADTTEFENHLACQSIGCTSQKSVQGVEQNAKVHQGPSIGKILGVPIYDKPYSLLKTCPLSDDKNAAKVEPINHPHCGRQQILKDLVLEKGLNSSSNIIRHQIDLNLCLVEEEIPLAPVTPNASVKNAVEIDLEAPAVFDIEKGNICNVEMLQCKIKKPCEPPHEKFSESREGLVKHAAEAIVTLSSISTYDPSNDFCSIPSDSLTGDALLWFADMVFCHHHELENDSTTASKGSSSCEEYSPDDFDYFEFMTLKLTEIKLEACSYTPNDSPTDLKDEDTLPKRPRRGQARRGRPRKDFIRDILPTISSLSRHQVTEDIQTFEAIVRASGGTWESSLAKRKNGKNRCGRGRKRISTPAPITRTNSSPSRQQTDPTQAILDEGRLVGWGKKTRRPPRQRGPVTDASLLVK